MAARAALPVALRVTEAVILVVVGEQTYKPVTAAKLAVTLDAIGGQANSALAKRVGLCAQAGLAKEEERKVAREKPRRVFADGWDYATRLPVAEFRAMPAAQQAEYRQLHRDAVAAAARAAKLVVTEQVTF